MSELIQIERMNGKSVYNVPAKSVINFKSGFSHKLLCDGPTFSAGSACAFGCTYCYVVDLMRKSPHLQSVRDQHAVLFPGTSVPAHSEIIIRRQGVLEALFLQLTSRGQPKFTDPEDQRVIYMSPLVDVAANPTLCEETIAVCEMILNLTNWHIRILSKSNFLPRIAEGLEHVERRLLLGKGPKERMIYGVSTGTLDNKLAQSFEEGTALVSKRLESLHWLQDHGFRTFGMICPSLPQENYKRFSKEICEAIRVDRCEHVWAEVMNLRGESFTRTVSALRNADYIAEATALEIVSGSQPAWEQYARLTFEAHTEFIPAKKLRFLQYVTSANRPWWEKRVDRGAVLLR